MIDSKQTEQRPEFSEPRSAILFEYVKNSENATIEVATEHYAIGYIFHGSCRILSDSIMRDVVEHSPYVLDRGHHMIESVTDDNNVFEQIMLHLDIANTIAKSDIAVEDEQTTKFTERLESVVLSAVTENVSLEELAERCFVSVSTFKRRFRNRFSMSPHRWFLARKLELAYRITLRTNLSIADVARVCGFVNASHFISTFKRYYKMTPASIRRDSYKETDDK